MLKEANRVSLGAVHTHTHTHTSTFRKIKLFIYNKGN